MRSLKDWKDRLFWKIKIHLIHDWIPEFYVLYIILQRDIYSRSDLNLYFGLKLLCTCYQLSIIRCTNNFEVKILEYPEDTKS